jgi:putative ABC transport system permease protein
VGTLLRILRDIAFGARLLGRAPGVSVAAALIIALGVGTTTAVFSVVYGVLLRPLPYPEPSRLVALWTKLPNGSLSARVNPADQRDLRAVSSVFEDIAVASAPQNFNLTGAAEPERLLAARLSSNLFSVLRVYPAIGRPFTLDDERSGSRPVVLLGDGLWRRRFGADPSVVGRTINLSGTAYDVLGVMPADFHFPSREYDLWIPIAINPRTLARVIADYNCFGIGRLKAGVSIERARREVDQVSARLEAAYPTTNRGVRLELFPLAEESIRPVRAALLAIFGAVACLLLIACFNLAGLLAARAATREREFLIRLALGASHRRLLVQALAEILPLLVAGGVAGVFAARLAVTAFVAVAPAALPRVERIDINGPVLAFSIVVLIVTGVVAGLLPAIGTWRPHLFGEHIGARSTTASPRQRQMRAAVVVAQIALTMPLLVSASALARNFAALMTVDPGFSTTNVLTLHMAIPRTKYPTDQDIAALYRRVLDSVSAQPGVSTAAMVNRLPLAGNEMVLAFEFPGMAETPLSLQSRSVTPDYFKTLNIPVRDGRVFTENDTVTGPLVAVIDDRLARTLWGDASAVGKRFHISLPGSAPAWGEIIGVVGTIRHGGLESDTDRQVYFTYRQFTDGRIALVVRTQSEAAAMTPTIVRAIRAVDPDQPVYDVRTMEAVVARSTAERRLNRTLIGVFAMSAMALAIVGLYGLVAYGVTQRLREFGVRIAVGAAPSEISRIVVRSAAKITASGAALGLVGSLVAARIIERFLRPAASFDPVNFVVAAVALGGVALIASYLPARRAAHTDPVRALRAE